MLELTESEHRVLDGCGGRLKQVAMQNIVRYAEVLGAESLCEVTKATVFCGAHHYLDVCRSDDFDVVFSKMNMATDEVLDFNTIHANCYVQSCVSPCDYSEYQAFGQPETFFHKNKYFLERARRAGVNIVGTCAPYLTGWLPIKGEHFVTTESGVTVVGNSLWGAMGNADGIEAAFWSAICGRTPRWGKHIARNRAGTHRIEVKATIKSMLEWDLLGKAIGDQLTTGSIPVVSGDLYRVTFDNLRQMMTALAISSNCEMCHMVGYTPEARTVDDAFQGTKPQAALAIDGDAIQKAYDAVCTSGERPIDFVSLGCPHYSIHQIQQVAAMLDGRKVHPDVQLTVWTVYPIKAMADENGYTRIVEDAGGSINCGTCPASIGDHLLDRHQTMLFDSLKQAEAVKSASNKTVYYCDTQNCVDAAVKGKFSDRYRYG